jgi:hypothetical protein
MFGFWIEPKDRADVVPQDVEVLLETPDFVATRVRFEILSGLETYAVQLVPKSRPVRGGILIQHGYGGSPELACGLTPNANAQDYAYRSIGVRAVRRGFVVVAVHHPSGYGTLNDVIDNSLPGFEQHPTQYGKNRLHRMAQLGGATLFGLDLMASSRGIDMLASRREIDPAAIGMYGLSQGGQTALFLPAVDTRVRVSVCSAYFNDRLPKLIGPIPGTSYLDSREEDKFFGEVVRCFADPNVVSLIAPRAFAVEAGLLDGAVEFEASRRAFARARIHYELLGILDRIEFIPHEQGHVSATRRAFEFLESHLAVRSMDEVVAAEISWQM